MADITNSYIPWLESQLPAEGGLGDVQVLGRPGDVPLPGHRQKVAEQPQFHGVHMYGSGSEYRISFILPAPVQARYVRISLGDSWRYSGEYCCANVRELNFYVK